MDIAPLHVWSGYSLCRGCARPERLIERAAELGHRALAITDVNGLYGAPVFWRQAVQAGVRPIVGAELHSGDESIVALVIDRCGYENLCRIITRLHEEISTCRLQISNSTTADDGVRQKHGTANSSPTGRGGPLGPVRAVPQEDVGRQRHPHPARTGRPLPRKGEEFNHTCRGNSPLSWRTSTNNVNPIGNLKFAIGNLQGLHLLTESIPLTESLLDLGVPQDHVWLELDPAAQERTAVLQLAQASERLGVGLLATGKAMLLEEQDIEVARVLAAIRLGRTTDALSPADLPHPKAMLRSAAQLRRELADFPQAVANNRRVADECRYALLPQKPIFPDYQCPPGRTPAQQLRRLCEQGARWRYARVTQAVRDRVNKELDLIQRKGFSEYFLVVRDIVQYARFHQAPTAGRGSGASSLVAYVLGITNVCPLAMDIPFERFLNERREDFPDLDIDFCWRIRDDVIDYAFRRWGADHVAMVCTHNTFQDRSAFRETAKAFGLSDEQISDLQRSAKLVEALEPRGDQQARARAESARVLEMTTDERDRCRRIVRLSRRLVGLPHLLSVHPGGIVIGRKPIDHYAPIEQAAKGVRITQYDKDGVEDIGLVKLDLLGNRSLSTIRQACQLVNEHRESQISDFKSQIQNQNSKIKNRGSNAPLLSMDAIPPSDPATFDLLRRADTVGCNQLESPAMRHLLGAMQPKDLRDVMKALALIRPGAAGVGMKEAFIRRQRGLEGVPKGHPGVDRLLAGTHGVMLYEDDVMLVAAELLGGSLAEADRFRKAVQKCPDDARRLELTREFLGRCRANGVGADYAAGIWVQMAKFNAYSFCRAHAASYARLAYAVAYLKAHHPLEFWTAALNNNQSMYHPRVYVEQAKRAGVRFLLPDVNRSREEFCIEGGAIRVGLNRVEGLGPASISAILAARGEPKCSNGEATRCLRETVRQLGTPGAAGIGIFRPEGPKAFSRGRSDSEAPGGPHEAQAPKGRQRGTGAHSAVAPSGLQGKLPGTGGSRRRLNACAPSGRMPGDQWISEEISRELSDTLARGLRGHVPAGQVPIECDRPYTSLSDFLDRSGLGAEEARALVLCGAMDAFGPTRSALMLELRLWRPQKAGRRSVGAALLTAQPTVAGGLEDLPLDRRRADQRRILGISVDEHPLRDHRSGLSEKTDADSRDLPRLVGRRVRIAGLLEALRVTRTRNGRTVRFFTFDDEWGLFEATAFAENSRIDDRMDADAAHGPDAAPAVVTGRVEDQYGFPIVAAERITWQE